MPDYLRMSASKLTTGWAMPHAAQRQGALSAFADIYSQRRAAQPFMSPLNIVPSFSAHPAPGHGASVRMPAVGGASAPYRLPQLGHQQPSDTASMCPGDIPLPAFGYMQPSYPHTAPVPAAFGAQENTGPAGRFSQGQAGTEVAGPSSATACKPRQAGGGFEGMSLAEVLATAPKKVPPPFMQRKIEQQQESAPMA